MGATEFIISHCKRCSNAFIGCCEKKKLICFFLNNEKKFNFLSSGPSLPLFSSIKKNPIKNVLYISGVFIKISKMCSKMAYNNNKKDSNSIWLCCFWITHFKSTAFNEERHTLFDGWVSSPVIILDPPLSYSKIWFSCIDDCKSQLC